MTRNPYRLLISEIMLQQTQVSRVLLRYPEFLKTFPTLESIARRSRTSVIRAWKGMGYNNRAVRLHELARVVVSQHSGRIPRSESDLRTLPGIGRYTARALLAFAFGKDVAAIDTNGRRVLSRVFWRMERTDTLQSPAGVLELAEELLPEGGAYAWNQALMDLGATICTARAPRCRHCPMKVVCASFGRMKSGSTSPIRQEPSIDGLPNRIYRGRIVERLRRARRGVPIPILGRSIHAGFSRTHRKWLYDLLRGLQKDGLVKLSGNGSRMVSLA